MLVKEENNEFILMEWKEDTKEFFFLGHKIDWVSNPDEWIKYLNDLVCENKCLESRLRHLLKSSIIRDYDTLNPKTKEYNLDIEQLDELLSHNKTKKDIILGDVINILSKVKDGTLKFSIEDNYIYCENAITKEKVIVKDLREE